MRLIIVAESYEQFHKFVRMHFPYLSRGLGIEEYFAYIVTEDDLEKVYGLECNQPILYIGGQVGLVMALRRQRYCVQIYMEKSSKKSPKR